MISEFLPLAPGELGAWSLRLIFSQTVIWLTTGLIVWLLRRSSAALRHRIWALSVLAALALPVLILALPSLRLGWIAALPGQARWDGTSTRSTDGMPVTLPAARLSGARQGHESGYPDWGALANDRSAVNPERRVEARGSPPNRSSFDNRLAGWWLGVFLIPAIWGLWQLIRGLKTAERIVAESQVIDDPVCRQLLAALGGRLEWRGAVGLRQSAQMQVPICLGWREPCIVLPNEWRGWPAETLRAVLAHELSHAVRRDVAWQVLARVCCAVYWFHPLAWLAAWRMRVEREFACDDSVLRVGEKPTAYARALLDVAGRLRAAEFVPGAAAMVVQSGLERRVRAILAANRPRLAVGARAGQALLLATLLTALLAGAVSPFGHTTKPASAAGPKEETQPALGRDDTPRAETRAAKAPTVQPEPAAERPKSDPPAVARLYIANRDGSGMKPLEVLPEYVYHGSPRWSPDGKRIAFNIWKDGEDFTSGKIAVVNVDGGNPRILSDGLLPSFSPRGDQITFSRPGPDHGVWVMSADGPDRNLQQIDENGWGSDWSQDGRIVYSTAAAGRANLVVFDPAAGRRQFLFDKQESPYKQIFWSMAWSPDSRRIVFKGLKTDDKYEVGIVDSRGEKLGLVHRIEGEVPATFAWSADGSRVLMCQACPERARLIQMYSFDPDSDDPPQLLAGQDPLRNCVDVAWSLDGKRIVVSYFVQPITRIRAARAAIPPERLPAGFVAGFKDKPPDPNVRRLVETTDARYVSLGDGGLRMHLPAGEEKPNLAGISTKFAIRGDFELIAVFHSLKVHKPAEGWGAGLDLLVQLGTGPKDFILVERKLSGAGESVFATKHGHVDRDGQYQWKIKHNPPDAVTAGKIKVVRKGATVYYLFAEYGTDEYHLLDEKVISAEDVHLLKFVACANDEQAGSDVILEKLEIRAEELPDLVK